MSRLVNLSRRKFIWGLSCTCGSALFFPSCSEVEISGRKQINIFPDDYLYSRTFPVYENFKSKSNLITGTTEYNNLVDIGYSIRDAIAVYYANKGEANPTDNFYLLFINVFP